MNIATLKEIIKDLPDTMEVLVSDADADFTVQPATLAQVTNVVWSEDGTKSEPFAEEDCLIIQ